MNFINRNAGVIALIAVLIAVGAYFFPPSSNGTFGQIVDTFTGDIFDATTSFKLNGTAFFTSAGFSSGLPLSAPTTTTERFTEGAAFLSTTTAATATTLNEATLQSYKGIAGTYSGGAMTYTLPASSTITSWIPNNGDSAVYYLAPTTNGIVLAAGTGFDLENSSTTATDLTVVAGNSARVTFIRKANTDIFALFEEFMDAD